MPDRSRQEWLAVLDALELTITETAVDGAVALAPEGDGAPAGARWVPPAGLGPIPPELVDRAQRIREAQRRTVATLQAAVKDNRQHHALIGAVNGSTARSGAVYLDVAG
ncbi:hypothetical protein [Arthrobacter flavus]|uniref:Flagellar protein FlgN n=1 Tax=Arthrobacter flavus TaxID=95172 RepID=A0ABW4Q392_9MICC